MLKMENKDLEHNQYDNHRHNARRDAGRAGEFHDGVRNWWTLELCLRKSIVVSSALHPHD
jgi:hypothetical protein